MPFWRSPFNLGASSGALFRLRHHHPDSITVTGATAAILRFHDDPGGLHRHAFGLPIRVGCRSPSERAVAVSVASVGAAHWHLAGSAGAAAGVPLVGQKGCTTSYAANTFIPFSQCYGRSLIPSNDDRAIGADNPVVVSFSRKPLPPK